MELRVSTKLTLGLIVFIKYDKILEFGISLV